MLEACAESWVCMACQIIEQLVVDTLASLSLFFVLKSKPRVEEFKVRMLVHEVAIIVLSRWTM